MTGAVVELYNLWLPYAKSPTNGYYVFRYQDGCRLHCIGDFKQNERAARDFAQTYNAGLK